MAWTPLLLMLLLSGSESESAQLWPLPQHPHVSLSALSLSQPVLTQPPSLSASPGASARLTCTLSSDVSVGSSLIFWYQQKPGSPPGYLLSFYSEPVKHQGSGVPSHFSGSKDTSANAGLLLISGLKADDKADYYCATASHGDIGREGNGMKTSAYSDLSS
uniref:Ig-like domain-containing protein n=1 Tax=Equus caballus TaxID=9796 RepID=A0A3Q2H4Y1_HORSE